MKKCDCKTRILVFRREIAIAEDENSRLTQGTGYTRKSERGIAKPDEMLTAV